jgi:hypothetical protein
MRNLILSSILTLLVTVMTGCKNDDFSPLGNLEKNYAAFCIIDNRTKYSYVRINKIYFTEGDKLMSPATVVKIQGDDGTSSIMRDTVFDVNQKERVYYAPINFWWRSISSLKGMSYHLTVTSPGLPTHKADAFVLKKPTMSAKAWRNVTRDGTLYYNFDITAEKEDAPIFLFTMFIEYEVGKVKNYMEVPIAWYYKVIPPLTWSTDYPIYHWDLDTVGITFTSLSPYETKYYNTTTNNIALSYSGDCMEYALNSIRKINGDDVAHIKRGIGVIYLVDRYLYEYFLSQKTDRYSVRLDESYYSTNFRSAVGNGLGFFGSITADTVGYKIFDELITKHHLINDQLINAQ